MPQHPSQLSLGGLSFLLSAAPHPLRLDAEDAYKSFLTSAPTPAHVSEVLHVKCVVAANPCFSGEAIFRSSATWSILAQGSDRALEFRDPDGGVLYVAQFRPGSDTVTVLCSPRLLAKQGTTEALDCPLRYPLDQVLTMYLLGASGIVLHAAGALVRGKGMALAGVSGAGKSTLMRLAEKRAGWEPLSDDRVIVRINGDSATLHGTPWPGEGHVAENRCGALARLFFLEQARTNAVRPLGPQEALARLLRTVSVPWYDTEYLGRSLATCGRVLASVPSALLAVRPEPGALDLVERCLAQD